MHSSGFIAYYAATAATETKRSAVEGVSLRRYKKVSVESLLSHRHFLSDGGRLPPLQAVRNKYVSVAGVNPPSDKRSARMRRDSEKYYVG